MKKELSTFALFGNIYQAEKSASIRKVIDILHACSAHIAIEQDFYHYIHHELNIPIENVEIIRDHHFSANFAISLGGDGTFLKSAEFVGDKEIPIIGINTGHLGFLADISPDEIDELFHGINCGEYIIEKRSLLKVTTDGHDLASYPFALNEVAVLKHDNSSMISINVRIDDNYLTTYQADGLIISTPTGSTGYSLSVGGPVITPSSHALLLTPVAAHSLNVRPIVVKDDVTIHLIIRSRNHNFLTAIDGRSESCPEEMQLMLRKAPYCVYVVKKQDTHFFDTLRNKLMWGADKRI